MTTEEDGAPQGSDVVFDLDAASFSSNDFRMYQFKVKRCPRARAHDWTVGGWTLPPPALLVVIARRSRFWVLLGLARRLACSSAHPLIPSRPFRSNARLPTLAKKPSGVILGASATRAPRARSSGG